MELVPKGPHQLPGAMRAVLDTKSPRSPEADHVSGQVLMNRQGAELRQAKGLALETATAAAPSLARAHFSPPRPGLPKSSLVQHTAWSPTGQDGAAKVNRGFLPHSPGGNSGASLGTLLTGGVIAAAKMPIASTAPPGARTAHTTSSQGSEGHGEPRWERWRGKPRKGGQGHSETQSPGASATVFTAAQAGAHRRREKPGRVSMQWKTPQRPKRT